MSTFKRWCPVFLKRFLKKPFFLILLLLPPLGGILLQTILPNLQITIPAGIYIVPAQNNTASDAELTNRIAERLYKHDGLISFIAYDSAEDLQEAVIRQEVQCGYLVPADLKTHILNNTIEGIVTVYEAPNALITSVINELVVSTFFRELSFETLIHDTVDTGLFSYMTEADIRAEMAPVYDQYNSGGYTLQFDYNRTISKASLSPDYSTYLLSPCLGFTALLIFIASFAGCVIWYQDRENGVFLSMHKGLMLRIRWYYSLIPALLCSVSGYLFLLTANLLVQPVLDFIWLLAYGLLTALAAQVLTGMISHILTFTACIPVLTIGSIICTPMFFPAETWLPVLSYVKYLFPPAWYFLLADTKNTVFKVLTFLCIFGILLAFYMAICYLTLYKPKKRS